jgi:hypothetical protein
MSVLLLVLTFAVLILVDALVVRHGKVKGGCATAHLRLAVLALLSGAAATAQAALPGTTPSGTAPADTFWLDLTNVALGLVTLACLVPVLVAVAKEIAGRRSVDSTR